MPIPGPKPFVELVEVGRAEEKRQARGLAQIADESAGIAGGVMGRGAPGVWTNFAVGLGLDGPVSGADVEALIEFYASRGIEPRVEVCPFADATLVQRLGGAGFRLRSFENVLFRETGRVEIAGGTHPWPPGLRVGAIDRNNAGEVSRFAWVSVSGFMAEPTPECLAPAVRMAGRPGVTSVGAWLDGEMVGAGSMAVDGEAAGFFGATVLAKARRRGIQQALLAWRLGEAARLGARIAAIGSQPGAPTERNVRRMGFELAYTKVVMVMPRDGLAPMGGD